MSFVTKHAKLLTIAVCCLAVGAGASAIATAGASTSSKAAASTAQARFAGARAGALRRLVRHTVQANLVVATRTGLKMQACATRSAADPDRGHPGQLLQDGHADDPGRCPDP